MRKIIENPTYMTYEDMEEKFNGKWVLIANCVYGEFRKFLGGTPVAVSNIPFKEQDNGLYNEFKDPKYAPRIDINFSYESRIYENPNRPVGFGGGLGLRI